MEYFGLGILALRFVESCQEIENSSYFTMLRAESFLINSQSMLVEQFRLSIVTLIPVQQRQIVEAGSHIRML